MQRLNTTRRGLFAVAVLLPAMAGAARAADGPAACAPAPLTATQRSMRSGLGYRDVSDDPKRVCGGCAFFTATAQPPACGKCQLLNGPVAAGGRCDSWAQRQ